MKAGFVALVLLISGAAQAQQPAVSPPAGRAKGTVVKFEMISAPASPTSFLVMETFPLLLASHGLSAKGR